MQEIPKKFDILLVEDNPGDVRLTQEILKDSTLISTIHVVYDGEEAMNYLLKKAPYEHATYPHLILLDLNLPKKNGLEVLAELKTNANLRHIPVVVLTSSDAEHDITKSYKLLCNAYIKKPVDFEQYHYVVKYIEKFWFTLAKLP